MPTTAQYNERLRRAFQITNSDLEANRAGRITPSQQQRIEEKKTNRIVTMGGGLGVMAIFMCVIMAFGSPTSKRYSPTMGLMGLVVIVPIAAVAMYMYEVAPAIEEAQNPQFSSTQGEIQRRITWNRTSKYHEIILDGEIYRVDAEQYEAFTDGETYILYHTARNTVLAAEHVEI